MTENKAEELKQEGPIVPNEWLIKPCSFYKEEYQDCTSIRGRCHQHFVNGETIDCSQWKRDYNNCLKWTEEKDEKAALNVINSEESRRMERLGNHYGNDVWKKRNQPPPDWDKPLPEFLAKRYENTFLAVKANEIKSGIKNNEGVGFFDQKSFCVIM